MLISLNWLQEYVDVPVDVQALADRLTLAGNEVERIVEQDVDFENVLVAEVQGLRPLPGSTKNQLASVTTGRAVTEVVTGIDDNSRFVVSAKVVARATARPVCEALLGALHRHGVPEQVLTDIQSV